MFERPDISGVPAAPNECVVRGRINRISPSPEGEGHLWELKVEETDDVEGMRNFARTRVGDEISIFVPPGAARSLKKGDRVEARLSYEGDEHGGMFFLKEKGAKALKA
jgi:hypothetical protein